MRNLIALAAILGLAGSATGFSVSAPKSNYQLAANDVRTTLTTTRQQSGLFPIPQPQRKTAYAYSHDNKLQMTSASDESIEEQATTSNSNSNEATTEALSANGSGSAVNGSANGSAVSTNGSTKSSDSTATTAVVSESKGGEGFRWILLPTLLFKFTIVLAVKFATDVIVFPLLWTYRLARLGKRKIVNGVNKLFGRGGNDDTISTMKVNGDS